MCEMYMYVCHEGTETLRNACKGQQHEICFLGKNDNIQGFFYLGRRFFFLLLEV
jgi:hypothetical protein